MSSSAANQGAVQAQIDAGQKKAMAIGFAGLVGLIAMGVVTRDANPALSWQPFFRMYLVGFVFWAAITVGSLGVLMIHHMTGGWWGYPLRRILEASARTLPVIAVLFVPLLFFLNRLYLWAQPDVVSHDDILTQKAWYLNTHGFLIRAAIYFAIWMLLTYRLTGLSAKEEATGDPGLSYKMERTSAPGLVLGAFTLSVAAIDWVMSLEAHWFSTIWGFLFIVIFLLSGYSFTVITFSRLAKNEPLKDALEPSRYLDIGNLLLAFTILWAYLSFDQFLIIWSGNLKDEIPFYMSRFATTGWGIVGGLLLLLHFFVPFFLLLQRSVKRKLPRLAKVAMWQLGFELVDLYWLIVPSYQKDGPRFADLGILLAVAGMGGLWVSFFLGQLKRLPLLPAHDPRFPGRAPAIPPTSEFLHVHGRRPAE